jgi:hypothetical protein
MHPFLTPELACLHENDVRREVAAARGPGRRRVRRLVPARRHTRARAAAGAHTATVRSNP